MDWLFALNQESYEAIVIKQFGEWNHAFQRQMFDSKWHNREAQILIVNDLDSGVLSTIQKADHFWVEEIQIIRSLQNQGIGTKLLEDCMAQA